MNINQILNSALLTENAATDAIKTIKNSAEDAIETVKEKATDMVDAGKKTASKIEYGAKGAFTGGKLGYKAGTLFSDNPETIAKSTYKGANLGANLGSAYGAAKQEVLNNPKTYALGSVAALGAGLGAVALAKKLRAKKAAAKAEKTKKA